MNKSGELISKYLLGVLNDEEKLQLQKWLDESKSNKAFFDKVCASDKISSQYNLYKSIDEKEAYQQFLMLTKQKQRKFYLQPLFKYAAVLLVAVSIALSLLLKNNQGNNLSEILPGSTQAILVTNSGSQIELGPDSVSTLEIEEGVWVKNQKGNLMYSDEGTKSEDIHYNTLVVPRGGEYKITLADGTKVHLNAASELKYPTSFSKKNREVYLKGEAFFEVAKDEKRPFFVHANNVKIKQYGTGFNVKSRTREDVDVVLVHGSVSVIIPGTDQEYMMQPSQLARYNKNTLTVDLQTVDVEPYIGWTKGRFIFENRNLKDIMESLSLWYDFDYEFKENNLAELQFTGNVSREATIESIFKSVEFTTNVKIELNRGKVVVSD